MRNLFQSTVLNVLTVTGLGALCSFVLSVALADALAAKIGPPIQQQYEAEPVAENIYVIHGPSGLPDPENQGFMNNPGFIITDVGVVVIDAGSSVQIGRMVLDQITAITDQPVVAAFATHIHGDHWLGNQAIVEQYPDAKMYAHPGLIESANAGEAENWVDLMRSLTGGATDGTLGIVPGLMVNDDEVYEFGEHQLAIHHKGVAHTNTDIAILVEPTNTMFTGDLVVNSRMGRMDDGGFLGLIETLDYLKTLKPEVVVPGHGQTANADLLAESSAFHSALYQAVERLYEEGLSDFEMKDAVSDALIDYQHYPGFEESLGRLIGLAYLEVEENNF